MCVWSVCVRMHSDGELPGSTHGRQTAMSYNVNCPWIQSAKCVISLKIQLYSLCRVLGSIRWMVLVTRTQTHTCPMFPRLWASRGERHTTLSWGARQGERPQLRDVWGGFFSVSWIDQCEYQNKAHRTTLNYLAHGHDLTGEGALVVVRVWMDVMGDESLGSLGPWTWKEREWLWQNGSKVDGVLFLRNTNNCAWKWMKDKSTKKTNPTCRVRCTGGSRPSSEHAAWSRSRNQFRLREKQTLNAVPSE